MIDLTDFPAAFRDYLLSKVIVEEFPVVPAQGLQISPGEEFSVKVRVTNATSATGIGLKNVRIHIWVTDPSIAKLRANPFAGSGPDSLASTPDGGVGRPTTPPPDTSRGDAGRPPGAGVGTSSAGSGRPSLASLASEITYERARMAAGEMVEIELSECFAEPHTGDAGYVGGQTEINCEVLADVDPDALFPKNQSTATAVTSLIVTA